LAKYSREIVNQVLTASDIVELIGASLELRPSGSNRFVGLCPFHNEKTPSFSVSRERQSFYCFGCEKGGDAVTFVMEFEGLSFMEALRKLADRAGIRLPAPSEREDKEDYLRRQLIDLGTFAARLYTDTLRDALKGGKARQYVKTRQLKEETIKRFGLGYAPDAWGTLVDAARVKSIKDPVIEASGLAKRGDKGLYDLFRDRLMIPIRDVSGNVVAFGGRDLSGTAPGKYINSPENPVYKKSRVLYGLFEARDSLRSEKRALLVEGYFDLMRCFDAGVCNVVASCGTALTHDQAALLRRYVPEVVVVFDGDAAGVRAALRGVAILTDAELTVRALVLPDGKDPDDYIRDHGVEAFRALVDQSLDFVTFYIRLNGERLTTIEGRTTVAKEVFTIVQGIDDAMRVDEYLKLAARELQLDEWNVRREFAVLARQRQEDAPKAIADAPREDEDQSKLVRDDCDFIAVLLSSEPLREMARKELAKVRFEPGPLAAVLEVLFADDRFVSKAQQFENEQAQRLYAAAANRTAVSSQKAEDIVRKQICRLKQQALRTQAKAILEDVRRAEHSGDTTRRNGLLAQKECIEKEIRGLGAA
jgi:DNA primase